MIIDAHYHLDERMEPIDTLIEKMNQTSIDKVVLIAALVDPFAVDHLAEKLSGLIRKSLMGSFRPLGIMGYNSTVTGRGQFKILTSTYTIYEKPDNDEVMHAMKKYPDRFYGWIFVNPKCFDPIKEIEERRQISGWIGVKCHPFWHQYPIRLLTDTAKYCEDSGLPLLVHLGGKKERGDFRYLPDQFPELKIIYAHAGIPFYRELWDDIKIRKNVWIDLSSPYLDEYVRNEALKTLGPSRCIFGSDGPFGYEDTDGGYDHGAIIREIDRFPISTKEKAKIFNENFREIIHKEG
ncbi:MAG: amidohydrolase [Proteobacteria bacterium]|nr:amidohydrolase [Pseudomonadota bacterium]